MDSEQAGTADRVAALVRLVDDVVDECNTRHGVLTPEELEAVKWCIEHL